MQYRTKYWLLKIIRNYSEKLLNCYQIAVRDKVLAAHILLHALLSLSLPGRSHREENVVDEDNVYSEESISGASRSHHYDGCHPSLGR